MLDSDKNTSEAASQPVQRFHHGPLGQVLERYLDNHSPRTAHDYSLVELAQLWREAARIDPAIGLHLYAGFKPQDRHVLVQAAQYCAAWTSTWRSWGLKPAYRCRPMAGSMRAASRHSCASSTRL